MTKYEREDFRWAEYKRITGLRSSKRKHDSNKVSNEDSPVKKKLKRKQDEDLNETRPKSSLEEVELKKPQLLDEIKRLEAENRRRLNRQINYP